MGAFARPAARGQASPRLPRAGSLKPQRWVMQNTTMPNTTMPNQTVPNQPPPNQPPSAKPKYTGLGIAFGAALGVLFGILVGNVGVWLVLGVGVGILIGVSFRSRPVDCPQCEAIHRLHATRRLS